MLLDLCCRQDELNQWVDLRPYMNPSPYLVLETRLVHDVSMPVSTRVLEP
jgi:hypothetical protein